MATIPTAYTWTVGELMTASKLNSYLRDAVSFLLNKPYALLGRTTSQSITNSTTTDVGWDLELADSDGAHSTVTNNSRYIAQTAGVFSLDCSTPWAGNATGARELNFQVNALTTYAGSRGVPTANVSFVLAAGRRVPLSVGDYVTVRVWQSSGAGLNIDQTFATGPLWDILWERT